MIDQYFLVLTTIDLFVLTFMCILTKLSETLNSKQKRGFFLAFVLIGVISILEVITILVDGAPVHLRWLNILSNYLGFGLSPAVSLCLVYVLDKKQGVRRGFKTAVVCEAAYLISLALTLPGGMVFSVSKVWGDRIFEKCGIGRDEGGDGGKTLEIRGKRRLSARDGGANYQQS